VVKRIWGLEHSAVSSSAKCSKILPMAHFLRRTGSQFGGKCSGQNSR
jgi:hypothetical protein